MIARPVRTCVGCRRRFAIDRLVRITGDGRGHLVVGGPSNGRGVWLCRGSLACAQGAQRSRAIGRGLRVEVTGELERGLVEEWLDEQAKRRAEHAPSTVVS